MNKAQKLHNLRADEAALEVLVALDYRVVELSPESHHFRINERLDVWPSTKKYYDTRSHSKGEYEELETFVKRHLKLFTGI